MKKCPNCGTENGDDLVFCKQCGASLTEEQAAVDLKKPEETTAEAGYTPPVGTGYTPPVPATPAPQFYAAPQPARKVSGKAITAMILGLSGLGLATVALVYAIVGIASYYRYNGLGFGTAGLIIAAIGLGVGIPALILGIKGRNAGTAPANHGIAKCGKVTGLITTILCGIALVLAIIALIVHG